MDPDQGHWIRFWEDTLFWEERQICLFWHQNGTLLWRADLSFKNSVTGSGSISKCSNFLQDKCFIDLKHLEPHILNKYLKSYGHSYDDLLVLVGTF